MAHNDPEQPYFGVIVLVIVQSSLSLSGRGVRIRGNCPYPCPFVALRPSSSRVLVRDSGVGGVFFRGFRKWFSWEVDFKKNYGKNFRSDTKGFRKVFSWEVDFKKITGKFLCQIRKVFGKCQKNFAGLRPIMKTENGERGMLGAILSIFWNVAFFSIEEKSRNLNNLRCKLV